MDEGVDRLGGDGAQSALLAPLQPAGDRLRRPALEQALAHEASEPLVALQDGRPLAALAVAAFSVDRQVAAPGQGVAAGPPPRPGRPARPPPQLPPAPGP